MVLLILLWKNLLNKYMPNIDGIELSEDEVDLAREMGIEDYINE